MTANELDDTPETAPVVPPGARQINAARIRALRESPIFKRMKTEFRAEGARQRNSDGTVGAPCWLCGNRIDYKLQYPHPLSWSLDHAITVKERPDLLMDKLNFRHSHHDCNQTRGTDDPPLDLGVPSELW